MYGKVYTSTVNYCNSAVWRSITDNSNVTSGQKNVIWLLAKNIHIHFGLKWLQDCQAAPSTARAAMNFSGA